MKYRVIFHPLADKEYLETVEWYELQARGLGLQFEEYIDSKINLIATTPLLFAKKHSIYREAVVERFPFVIVYTVNERTKTVLIVAVYHSSRNPKKKYRK